MQGVQTRIRILFCLVAAAISPVCRGQIKPGDALPRLVHSNEIFGQKLLFEIRQAEADENIVVSPLPIFLAFRALAEGSSDSETLQELGTALDWKDQPYSGIASRMLLARIPREVSSLDKSIPPPIKKPVPPFFIPPSEPYVPISQSTIFIYKGKGLISKRFMETVTRDYGIQFQEAGLGKFAIPSDATARRLYGDKVGLLDFSITTFTDLRTGWFRVTFSPESGKRPFTVRTGETVQVDRMISAVGSYRHVDSENFEAIELPCGEAYLLVMMPAQGRDLGALERELIEGKLDLDGTLKYERGDVALPHLHVRSTSSMISPMQKLGVTRVFSNIESLQAMLNAPVGARLTVASQRVDLDVDEWGIKARAVTSIGGVIGGIEGGSLRPPDEPFHMIVDRPFLFFVRDNVTNVLLFIGAEMNPAKP